MGKRNTENKGLLMLLMKIGCHQRTYLMFYIYQIFTKDEAMLHLKEFIIYWRDSGIANNTWNSKFIEHVKRKSIINNIKNEKDKSIYKKESIQKSIQKKSDSWSDKLEF